MEKKLQGMMRLLRIVSVKFISWRRIVLLLQTLHGITKILKFVDWKDLCKSIIVLDYKKRWISVQRALLLF